MGKDRERFHREITALKRLAGHPHILSATFAADDAVWPKADGTMLVRLPLHSVPGSPALASSSFAACGSGCH